MDPLALSPKHDLETFGYRFFLYQSAMADPAGQCRVTHRRPSGELPIDRLLPKQRLDRSSLVSRISLLIHRSHLAQPHNRHADGAPVVMNTLHDASL